MIQSGIFAWHVSAQKEVCEEKPTLVCRNVTETKFVIVKVRGCPEVEVGAEAGAGPVVSTQISLDPIELVDPENSPSTGPGLIAVVAPVKHICLILSNEAPSDVNKL